MKRGHPVPMVATLAATTAAIAVRVASAAMTSSMRERCGRTRRARRPPSTAPPRKHSSAQRLAGKENPGAPAAAKPMRTTLPVMLAMNT